MSKKPTESRRNKVLKALLVLVKEKGFHGVPVSAVSQKAGVATGTIYHHFKSKEDLIRALYDDVILKMGQAITRNDNTILPFRERFENLWFNLFDWLSEHKNEFLFLEQYINSPFFTKEITANKNPYGEHLVHFLHEGQHSGQLIKMDLRVMVSIFYAHAAAVSKVHLSHENLDKKEQLQAEKIIWRALKSKDK